MSDEPREYTVEECRRMVLENFRAISRYWAREHAKGHDHAFDGVVFSILVAIDGGSSGPALTLLTDPHPDDKEFNRGEGRNWWPQGADLTAGVQLHDEYYAEERMRGRP
jgi:hypothetical protein